MTETPHDRPVRTRFAPSPTGRLHLGNVRIAIFNWLYTRRHGGDFVLRIEDTDDERNVEGAEGGILEDLAWLGLDWDEGPDRGGPVGPYRQSERNEHYLAFLDRLVTAGGAYPCFCDETEATGGDRRYSGSCRALPPAEAAARARAGDPHVLRFRVPDLQSIEIRDEVRGVISFPGSDIDDFVVRRRDGRPTYNFAVVVDDIEMRITDVIRGAGHLSNTPKQALLFDALGAPRPRFAHLPTVLAPDGGKLSKRKGAAAVAELRGEGWLPDAIVNYLSLLGWSHPDEEEILTRGELARVMDLDRVGASDTKYDPEKFRWVQQQHLARLDDDAFEAAVRPFVDRERFPLDDRGLAIAFEALRPRMVTLSEIGDQLDHVLPAESAEWAAAREALVADEKAGRVLEAVARELQGLDHWEPEGIRSALRDAGKQVDARGAALFIPVRTALTGAEHGPDLSALLAAAGKEEILRRFERLPGFGAV